MRVRATIRLRNDTMIRARERVGWNQHKLAKAAGISIVQVLRLERFDFSHPSSMRCAQAAADALCLDVWHILPQELVGERIESSRVAVADIDPSRLLASSSDRLMLPPPEDGMVKRETTEELRKHLKKLTFRLRTVLERRYGLDGGEPATLDEIGAQLNITNGRVRQLISHGEEAIRRMMNGDDPDPRFIEQPDAARVAP